MKENGQITISELVKRVETKKRLPKRQQLSYDILMEKIEQSKELMEQGLELVKKERQEEWKKEVIESPTNQYLGDDIKCAVTIMKGLEKGLSTRNAIYISEHYFNIPSERIRDILYKYSEEGEKFYKDFSNLERLAYYKRRVYVLRKYTDNL